MEEWCDEVNVRFANVKPRAVLEEEARSENIETVQKCMETLDARGTTVTANVVHNKEEREAHENKNSRSMQTHVCWKEKSTD